MPPARRQSSQRRGDGSAPNRNRDVASRVEYAGHQRTDWPLASRASRRNQQHPHDERRDRHSRANRQSYQRGKHRWHDERNCRPEEPRDEAISRLSA